MSCRFLFPRSFSLQIYEKRKADKVELSIGPGKTKKGREYDINTHIRIDQLFINLKSNKNAKKSTETFLQTSFNWFFFWIGID